MNYGSKYQIDMCHGPLFGKVVLFAVPLMLSNMMQLLFNAADLIVIGRYAPHEAMAAVGSCGSFINLLLNGFFGLSVAANVLAARYIGAGDRRRTSRSVHTAMALALYGGGVLAIIGMLIAGPALAMMKTPASVLPKAVLYMRIYCAGIPFILFYNFGSSVLRAAGDTRRPMVYMILSGGINVGLNLFFVRTFHMDVAGVALATLIANGISALLVVRTLEGMRDGCRLVWKQVRFCGEILPDMLKIGIPAGIQSSLFAFSNVIIQSTINSFGSEAMAGCAAAASLEAIVYVSFNAYYFTVISFVGQNYGAGRYKRIRRSIVMCVLLGALTGIVFGTSAYLSGRRLLGIYNPSPEVIDWGMTRLRVVVMPYFLCAVMDVLAGALRGLGHSVTPMIVSLLGACVFRVVWVIWIFPLNPTMGMLLFSYPVSWVLVAAVNFAMLYIVCRKLFRTAASRKINPVPRHYGRVRRVRA